MACAEVPQQPQPTSAEAATTNATVSARGRCGSLDGDLECLVCREPYGGARLPKLLGCRHAFCAVCLKLLLCVQDGTWFIICPLCRKATAVPGGLICSLRDQKAVVRRVAQPCPEVQLCPQELMNPANLTAGHPSLSGEDEEDAASANRVAARHLVAHLLLLVLLIILILPFVYPGVVQWTLTFIIALTLLMSILFCCHPNSQGRCRPSPRTLFCRLRKRSEISSVA